MNFKIVEKVIKGTKIVAKIQRIQFGNKYTTWQTDTHNKEHKITKLIHVHTK